MKPFLQWLNQPFAPMQWLYSQPVLICAVVFWIDFGMITLIRVISEKSTYLFVWWSFSVGDSICLPIYAFFAALIVREVKDYPDIVWHLFLLFLGYYVGNYVIGNGKILPDVAFSFNYHAVIYWIMFMIIGSPLPVVLSTPSKWRRWAILFLVLYLCTFLLDVLLQSHPV